MGRREIVIEPLTRIEGHLGIHAVADTEARKYIDAHSFATMFRGIEIILKGREPADAIWITQRICGVCPVPHATASSICVDQLYKVSPPPLGIAIRNFIDIGEELYDPVLGCLILEGPDYSQAIVEKITPSVWSEAQRRTAERRDIHGFSKISDIMEALNPVTGALWLKGVEMQKLGSKIATIFGGKHPHVQAIVPGGAAKTLTTSDLEMFADLLAKHIAFSKELTAVFDDLVEFYIELGYEEVGARESNLISYGVYEDIESYNCNYEDMDEWASKRYVSPGVIRNGELVTTSLTEINIGIREFVTHSYYDDWDKYEEKTDPAGNPIEINHPWNKETRPHPQPPFQWDGKYSWASSVRWCNLMRDRSIDAYEAGPLPRLWVTAKAKLVDEATGKSLKFRLPRTAIVGFKAWEEMELEWKVPEKPNTLERVRARAYFHAYTAYVAYKLLGQALELVKAGKTEVWTRYKKPSEGMGVGLTEAMRGALGHWAIMKDMKIYRYQIITPSAWNASPRDPNGTPGPYESAIMGSPITEETPPDEWNGLDIVRTIRSMDPCLACCVHVYSKNDSKQICKVLI